jgi:hypothetical protein
LLNERFDELFEDETYLSLKNSLFSYQLRRRQLLSPLRGAPVTSCSISAQASSPIIVEATKAVAYEPHDTQRTTANSAAEPARR